MECAAPKYSLTSPPVSRVPSALSQMTLDLRAQQGLGERQQGWVRCLMRTLTSLAFGAIVLAMLGYSSAKVNALKLRLMTKHYLM